MWFEDVEEARLVTIVGGGIVYRELGDDNDMLGTAPRTTECGCVRPQLGKLRRLEENFLGESVCGL